MKRRGPTLVGAIVGVAAALLVIASAGMRARLPESGPMPPDFGGPVHSVVMQYTAGSQFVFPVYQQYLGQQSSELLVYLLCPEPADFAELQQGIGSVPPRIIPLFTHHPMTAWSRDRWVLLLPGLNQPQPTLLAPRLEEGGGVWPQRAGDGRIAQDLARALPQVLSVRYSGLAFDGGDFLADGPYVFVTPGMIERNLQHRVSSRQELIDAIATELHLTPLLMENAPDHHAGMFMMSAGVGPTGRPRMLVADPSLGRDLFDPEGPEAAALEGGADFSPATQKRFDAVARLAAVHGYVVTRIPVVVPVVGKNYITYVNVILDEKEGHPIVYMSAFAGQPRLNQAAADIWQSLGYEVRPIDCSSVWTRGGTIHCLVNVLERGR